MLISRYDFPFSIAENYDETCDVSARNTGDMPVWPAILYFFFFFGDPILFQ